MKDKMKEMTNLNQIAQDKVRSMSSKEFATWCDSAEGKAWFTEMESHRQKEHERETSKLVTQVRTKLRAAGRADVVVSAAMHTDLDKAQDETEWNLITGAVVDDSFLVCKHKGDPTHGDFGTSFVVFPRRENRWDKNAMSLGPANTRPYNWGGRTTKSLDQALAAVHGVIAERQMRGKR